MIKVLLLALLLNTPTAFGKGLPKPFGQDAPLPTASAESVGLDPAILDAVEQQIAAKKRHKLHSFLVLRHGQLAFEGYYNGYTRDTPHDLRSATKSITSLLTGSAIEQGLLAGVDAPLMDSLGDAYPQVDLPDAIRLRHLLTMSSGLDCHDRDRKTRGQEDRMYRSKDWVEYFLSLSAVHPPGQTTRYCTGGVVALGEAISSEVRRRNLGADVADFAASTLFGPLGITNYQWARFDEGTKVDTGGHLLLTPQGMIKIGQLVLQGGRWEDRQLISEEWIRHSTREHTRSDGTPYGFLWWLNTVPYGALDVDVIMARGNGGQVIFIVPQFDLVGAATTGYYNSDKAGIVDKLFFKAILPSIEEVRGALAAATAAATTAAATKAAAKAP